MTSYELKLVTFALYKIASAEEWLNDISVRSSIGDLGENIKQDTQSAMNSLAKAIGNSTKSK